MNEHRSKRWVWLAALLVGLGLLSSVARLYVDWLWFQSLGYQSVFTTALLSRLGIQTLVTLLAFLFLWGNLRLALRKAAEPPGPAVSEEGREIIYLEPELPGQRLLRSRQARWLALGLGALVALVIGAVAGSEWMRVQQWLHAVPFGQADPLFGRDIAFYVFTLPLYRLLYSLLMGTLVTALLLVAGTYLLGTDLPSLIAEWKEFDWPKRHLAALLVLILLLKAWGYRLAQFDLLFSPGGVVFGAGYADIHARLVALQALVVVVLLVAAVVVLNFFLRRVTWVAAGLAAWLLVALGMGGIYPYLLQKLSVEPNEFALEEPYLRHSIAFTRAAFGLDRIENKPFEVSYALTAEDIAEEEDTIRNVRLWDWQQLLKTYKEIQEIRLYYSFNDVDIDRYVIDGKYRQVMVAARELSQDKLPEQARTWINQRLKYTHGYGVAVSPVNEVAQEGLPLLFIKDIPPRFTTDLKVTRPEIYFGESTTPYVFVNTRTQEFDYPSGDQNVYTTYQAESGVRVGSFARKLVLAWVFGDYRMLLSEDITPDSRVLFHRTIAGRTRHIAPFLSYDEDPYVVILDGRLVWVQDAYTTSDMYPYSTPVEGSRVNYIRNSVKVVVDAYTGETTYYVADAEDPLVRCYAAIFPRLFQPLEKMPPGLRAHLRYPVDLFTVQARMFATFHMQDPRVFYNKEDKWNIPEELLDNQRTPMQPYYIVMRLPGEASPEYVLMLPYTPARKQNMIAWLGARSDGDNYGRLLVYNFPKQGLVFGPMQVESRINQDARISEQLTLWDQRGSQAARGNLLVIPIKQSILYVEPLYLQAEASQIPELRRVIAVYDDQVVMEQRLDQCLARLFPTEGEQPPPGEAAPGATVAGLLQQAQELYDQAQAALKAGNWAGYGDNINRLGDVLRQMRQVVEAPAA
ncbi:MAG: UPF0182 family protein [Syntrophomonadaceae bacterium]|nr:UPF0182 family protein [Syntrophomonadaceae bacterium]